MQARLSTSGVHGSSAGRNDFDKLMARALDKGAEALFRNAEMRAVVARKLSADVATRESVEARVAEKMEKLLEGKKAGVLAEIDSAVNAGLRSALEKEFSNFVPPLKSELVEGIGARFVSFLGANFSEEVLSFGLNDISSVEGIVLEALRKAAGKIFSDVSKFEESAGFASIAASARRAIESARESVRAEAEKQVSSAVSGEISAVAGLALFNPTDLSERAHAFVAGALDLSGAFEALRSEEPPEVQVVSFPGFSSIVNVIVSECGGITREPYGVAIGEKMPGIAQDVSKRVLEVGHELDNEGFKQRASEMVSGWLSECRDTEWKMWHAAERLLVEIAAFMPRSRTSTKEHRDSLAGITACPIREMRSAFTPEELSRACKSVKESYPAFVVARAFIGKYTADDRVQIGNGTKFDSVYGGELKHLMVVVLQCLYAAGQGESFLSATIQEVTVPPNEFSRFRAALNGK